MNRALRARPRKIPDAGGIRFTIGHCSSPIAIRNAAAVLPGA